MTNDDHERLVSHIREVVANESDARDWVISFVGAISRGQHDATKPELEIMEGMRQAEGADRPWAAAALACVLGTLRESNTIHLVRTVQTAQVRHSDIKAEEDERSNHAVITTFIDFILPLLPAVRSKRKQLRDAAKGGHARKKDPKDNSVLCREVEAMHARKPKLSWSRVCTLVGEKYHLSGKQVGRRAKDADWRKPLL